MKKIIISILFLIGLFSVVSLAYDEYSMKWVDDDECREIIISGCFAKFNICPKKIEGTHLTGNTFNLITMQALTGLPEKQRQKEIDCMLWVQNNLYTDTRGYKTGSFFDSEKH